MRKQQILAFSVMALLAWTAPLPAWADAAVDCEQVMGTEGKDTLKLNPSDVDACRRRGWDAPNSWKPKEGKGSGITSGGARGFSYGVVGAPESPPGARNANASVSGSTIVSSCNFPPRIKIGIPPHITMPSGSCLDFLNDVFKDKNGGTNSNPVPEGIEETDTCPAETDTAGIYGVKQPLTGSTSIAVPCGGTAPITTSNLVLDTNAQNLAATEIGQRQLLVYKRNGNGFTSISSGTLPSYLCSVGAHNRKYKTVDLTTTVAQMISYSPAAGYLSIRLQSRATMDGNYIPEYNAADPEKFLVLPLNASGIPTIPANCADMNTYYRTPVGKQDIEIQSATDTGCENYTFTPTPQNFPTHSIFSGWTDHWKWQCGTTIVSGPSVICNEANGIPPSTCDASNTAAQTDASCDIVALKPAGAACVGKSLYGVLNRPTLYYPSGSNAVFFSVSGRTGVMALTVDNTKLYAQSNSIVNIAQTSPPLNFDEGGTLYMKDGSMLLMNPPATVNAAALTVSLPGGGQSLSSGGTQQAKYAKGTSYTIPASLVKLPLEVHVGRTVTLPAGYMVPTTPTVGSQPPYLRLPVDDPK